MTCAGSGSAVRQPGGRRARRYGGAPRQASQQPPEIRLCSAGPSFTRPSASGRRDLAPILLGALARPYVRSSPTRSGIHWRMGAVMCHLGLPMRAKRRRGPEQQKSQSRVHAGTSSVIAPSHEVTRNPPGQQALQRIIGGAAAEVAGAARASRLARAPLVCMARYLHRLMRWCLLKRLPVTARRLDQAQNGDGNRAAAESALSRAGSCRSSPPAPVRGGGG
jgi:hypothetical protein